MITPSPRHLNELAGHTTELGLSAPVVIAHRLTRLALAGPKPSAADQHEFATMGLEKVAAFQQAGFNMWLTSLQMSQQMMMTLAGWWMAPWSTRPSTQAMRTLVDSPLAVLNAGLCPVSRRAGANAKRLSRQAR